MKKASIFLALLVVFSGCTLFGENAIESTVKSLPQVQEFMSQFPNAELGVTKWTEEEVEMVADEISEDCRKPIIPRELYKATVDSEEETIEVWVDAENQRPVCVRRKGKGERRVEKITRQQAQEKVQRILFESPSMSVEDVIRKVLRKT